MNRPWKTLLPEYTDIILMLCLGIVLDSTFVFAQIANPKPGKKSGEIFKNVQVLKDVPSDQFLPSMEFITSSLGVQCEYCHVEKAFDRDDKETKRTARKMMQMMFAINAENFNGHSEVTCYSCHRGKPKPVAIPLIPESQPRLEPAAKNQHMQPALPSAEEIVQKCIAALGGAAALSKLTSLEEKGIFDAGSHRFPLEIFKSVPDRIATIIHFPGADSISVFNRTSGWIQMPGRPLHAMNSAETDASRIDADLHFPLELITFFPELKAQKLFKIGAQETILLTGERPGSPPVEMYFDTQTSLLIRVVRYAPSALGLNPTQIDYSDYSEINGVKTPFQWTSATPTGRFTVHVESAIPNAPIRNQVFSKPQSGS